jgi:hypothetical protein
LAARSFSKAKLLDVGNNRTKKPHIFQAHGICKKIESGIFVQKPNMTSAEYYFEAMLNTAKTKKLRDGWHLKLLVAFHLINRLKKFYRGHFFSLTITPFLL